MEKLGFVPQYYTMDPETEDLLPSGDMLRDGMVVLLESPSWRFIDVDKKNVSDAAFSLALERNRWCTITHLKSRLGRVSFVGVYEDGTKRMRLVPRPDLAWLVKLDSIPPHITESGKYEAVFAAVRAGGGDGLTKQEWDLATDKAVSRIFAIFEEES